MMDALAAAVVVGVFWLPPTLGAAAWWRSGAGLALAAITAAAMVLRGRLPTTTAGALTLAGGFAFLRRDG
ncbi:hypothetical protein ABZ897_27680 [Nonomuraea sp. NPDC046802]|uniref:hypothetical protein n=1 Tax=Nonomuraea sp. NPDC046802 TaxID=3154919 RepID=UPI0033F77030